MKDEKQNTPLVDRVAIVAEVYGAVRQLHSRLWNTTLATMSPCGHKAYVYVLLYIVDSAVKRDIDSGREGLTNEFRFLGFFGY